MEENLIFGISAENLLKTSTICWTQNCTECAENCSKNSMLVKLTMETQTKEIDYLKTAKKPFEFSMGSLGQNKVSSEEFKEKELKQLLDDCQQKEKKVEFLEGKIKDIVKDKETAESANNCLIQEILRLQSTIKNLEGDLTEARHLNTELQLCNTKLNYASQATTKNNNFARKHNRSLQKRLMTQKSIVNQLFMKSEGKEREEENEGISRNLRNQVLDQMEEKALLVEAEAKRQHSESRKSTETSSKKTGSVTEKSYGLLSKLFCFFMIIIFVLGAITSWKASEYSYFWDILKNSTAKSVSIELVNLSRV
ncbi:hypothetical protein B9Z55_018395 [Caenorhabditis nigoni]|uniref:Uncharacterized protein n=1 Tax=Caenorhabditis nigoni TaxID=1611254 RepID=A0A2G5TDY2_9PELO|nr:hypothetical protein B9Z55_018395 [Caenorhabditis nigoni]